MPEFAEQITEDEWDKIAEKLGDVKKLLSIRDVDDENKKKWKKVMTENNIILETCYSKVLKLLKELSEKA